MNPSLVRNVPLSLFLLSLAVPPLAAAPKVSHLQVAPKDLVTLAADASAFGTGVAFNQRLLADGTIQLFFAVPPGRCVVLTDVAWNVVMATPGASVAYAVSVGPDDNPGPNGLYEVARWDVSINPAGEAQGVQNFVAGMALGAGRAFFLEVIGGSGSPGGTAFGYLVDC